MPSLCSDVEQESMKVCATTDRQASVMLLLWMSKTNCGFFITFTQKRRGRLWGGADQMGPLRPFWIAGEGANQGLTVLLALPSQWPWISMHTGKEPQRRWGSE